MCEDRPEAYALRNSAEAIAERLRAAMDDMSMSLHGALPSAAWRIAQRQVAFLTEALNVRLNMDATAAPGRRGKVYLSGPMRGIPEFNFPAFKRKAEELRAAGWEVFSPAEADISATGYDFSPEHPEGKETDEPGLTARECLARDCKYICEEATHMYMMRGWEKSTGAQAEWALARAIHLPVMYEGDEA